MLLPQLLEQAGKAFDNVPLYTVQTDQRKQEVLLQELAHSDYVFLASSSAASAFAEMTAQVSYAAKVIAIGAATARTAKASGIPVAETAAQADITGMIKAVQKLEEV